MVCKKCGKELDDKAVVCVGCGCPVKKQSKNILKKWWFWVLAVLVVIVVAASGGDSETTNAGGETATQTEQKPIEIVYEQKDLKTMFAELESNAMKAEATYQDKYVEVTGKISGFDSDGSYISVQAVGADVWDFNSMMCYIKNDAQKQFLMEKNEGDTVIIKGKITSVGEILGYSLDIAEIQ